MHLEFWYPSPSISESSILSFETAIRTPLPNEYRQFLLTSNGGSKPKREDFIVDETREPSLLSELYSLTPEGRGELYAEFTALRQELPSDLISIGHDIGGNKLCLAISGEKTGMLFFLDHELRSFVKSITHDDLPVCSNSFEEFIANLT